jgi:hypothetical protein
VLGRDSRERRPAEEWERIRLERRAIALVRALLDALARSPRVGIDPLGRGLGERRPARVAVLATRDVDFSDAFSARASLG